MNQSFSTGSLDRKVAVVNKMVDDLVAVTKKDESVNVISFLTPKHTLLIAIKAGMAKCAEPWYMIAVLGFMAGAYIGVGGLFYALVAGGMPGVAAANPIIPRLLGAAVFPVGLLIVIFLGSDLFTGNVMMVMLGFMSRKVKFRDGVKSLVISYLANWAGAACVAFFLSYLTDIFHADPFHSAITKLADYKCSQSWGAVFLKGIGANWLVCLAVWCGLTGNDFAGKIMGIWWPVFTFVAIGFEHSIANMFLGAATATFGKFLAYNLIPSTLGNIVGGGLLVAGVQYFIFREHITPTLPLVEPKKRGDPPSSSTKNRIRNVNSVGEMTTRMSQVSLDTPASNLADHNANHQQHRTKKPGSVVEFELGQVQADGTPLGQGQTGLVIHGANESSTPSCNAV